MKNKKIVIILSSILLIVLSFGVIKYAGNRNVSVDDASSSSSVVSSEAPSTVQSQVISQEDKIYNELIGNLKNVIHNSESEEIKTLIKEIVKIQDSDNVNSEKSEVYKKIVKILDEVTLRAYSEEELNSYKNLFEGMGESSRNMDDQTAYKIESNGEITFTDGMGVDSAENRKAWENAKKIIPVDLLSKLDNFIAFSVDKDSGFAVGGFVMPDSQVAPKEWTIGVCSNADFSILPHILIHEFAHYVSMKDASIDFNSLTGDILEGFAEKGLGSIYDEFLNVEKDRHYIFYARHKDDFVSAYASTDILEDFAETFVKFVSDTEYESDIINSKISFMANNQELVEVKNKIKDNLKSNGINEIKHATT